MSDQHLTGQTLRKGFTVGTHRLVPPAETLARISPHLKAMQITRCADITGLDRIGIPVYCAVRPMGELLQLANGKGATPLNARVSALMEAIEHYHAEQPNGRLRRTTWETLSRSGQRVVSPASLPGLKPHVYFSQQFKLDWVEGEDLVTGEPVWLPASVAYLCAPSLYDLSTNGLASGNHLVEATLHGLYEVIERDAISQLFVGGRLKLGPERCLVMDLCTVNDDLVSGLLDKLERARVKPVLIWVRSALPVHTFWAVLLDGQAASPSTMVNVGYGTHTSPSVAAVRAITEAAQSRLSFIHGAREDMGYKIRSTSRALAARIYTYFDRLGDSGQAVGNWQTLTNKASDDLHQDLRLIIHALVAAGYSSVFRLDMTRAPFHIPVAKVLVPGLQMKSRLF
ncbi:MAG: hypothetical protein GX552_01430 [Chloroflexi bacterium]|jgi:ribosomal protein S12 methylthiotransferase accessory factor|nr:hypothetical protein [Chloroflexota bacterium]